MNKYQGWINLYKPSGISSFFALKKIKSKFFFNKIGHAGTLDPLAEGILPVAIGKTTKLISFLDYEIKEYEFSIKWGEETSTYDKEGAIVSKSSKIPSYSEIKSKLKKFEGNFFQKPPKSSAVKINGVRAYKLFRSNINFEISKKLVKIYELAIIDSSNTYITKFKVKCSKGFYIRSLARDLAELLGTRAHIYSLKRTKVGKFTIENSILLDDLLKISQRQIGFRGIHPSLSMLDDILAHEIEDENLMKSISHGKSIRIDKDQFLRNNLNLSKGKIIFLTFKKNILSFGRYDGYLFKPKKVFI